MSNKHAKRQIREGKAERQKFDRLIENFEYGQQRAGLDNPFAGLTNPFAGLTNPFASQRVATGAAEFQAARADEQTAATLDALVQAGGGGGEGATATALAQQQRITDQQIAAGLQQQEASIAQQTAQGAAQIQQLQAEGESRRQQLIGQGQQYILGLSEQRDAAELAGLGARFAGAQQTINTGYEGIAANNAALIGAAGNIVGGALSGAGAAGGFGKLFSSDHRLKENIEFDRFSPSGIGVYRFNYKGHPEHKFEGALSIAAPEHAVVKNFNGKYDGIDYDKIDVDFKKIN